MHEQQRSLRVGIAAILCALVFRFFSPEILEPVVSFLTDPDTVAFLIYAETGRDVRSSPEQDLQEEIPAANLYYAPESPPPAMPEWIMPAFADDAAVELDYGCGYRPDIKALLKEPLTWDLAGPEPKVLIYHTHTTESYQKYQQDYEETAPYRTLNPHYNVLSVGNRITEILENAGISVIHDQEVHDYPSYNDSYMHSRRSEQKILKEHPGILLALDIHRDAIEGPEGQMKTSANVGGKPSAQLMIVVGTNCRLAHKNWPQNLALGLKLHAQLESQNPGIARPLTLSRNRFNQDLCPGGLLIEVGTAGNSHGEAMLAAEQLAHAIVALSRGTAAIEDCENMEADLPAVPASGF